MLVNCVGMVVLGKFEDFEVSIFERLMSINYLGSVYFSWVVIIIMKECWVGRIVFVFFQVGQLGLFGFIVYFVFKFVIRGLVEVLQMEVKLYNVYIIVVYLLDIDIFGFVEENRIKFLEI